MHKSVAFLYANKKLHTFSCSAVGLGASTVPTVACFQSLTQELPHATGAAQKKKKKSNKNKLRKQSHLELYPKKTNKPRSKANNQGD